MRIVVGRVDEFEPGGRRVVDVGRRSIGVFRVGDRFYAISNHCPHQGGPLCAGRTAPWTHSDGPGSARTGEEHVMLACPWHGWEYELATGRSFLGPTEPPARSYQVSVASGETLDQDLDLRVPGRTPGPYVAETYPVRVEDDYVIVDTTTNAGPGDVDATERTGDRS
ncbi:Rieske (2Fe-2S) protein [Spiractinospora alimapuensis]|uniref:Rieske (2Fe-2S) protein n=1 Tax=Spiractinospora alimapuensis TaxID=2820884 RepID=UPI001F3BAEFB|nr:Rieske (2Fe-2S) protein [Spiractinospora alimapuensis]QVQ54311.1 Rieske (2Fe-2S) protein [Spiractinospora alimapuensis]